MDGGDVKVQHNNESSYDDMVRNSRHGWMGVGGWVDESRPGAAGEGGRGRQGTQWLLPLARETTGLILQSTTTLTTRTEREQAGKQQAEPAAEVKASTSTTTTTATARARARDEKSRRVYNTLL
jgi:hypothetical protein